MGLEFSYIEGQSPLNEEEKQGLIIKSISTRTELDEFEQQNIEKAIEWTLKQNFRNIVHKQRLITVMTFGYNFWSL